MPTAPSRKLVTFANPRPERDYVIRHECPEYTAVCPMTGQPDFGTIIVRYTPDRRCIELKSLKLYLWSFRDEGHFFEQATNQILDDLVAACRPRRMVVIGEFNVRGGIATRVVARYRASAGAERPKPRRTAKARG
jgi:7-cyano-7-deazaguanine reductase